jgi:hypothetical protein
MIGVAQDGENLCAFVIPVMNISFPQNDGNFLYHMWK